MKINVTICFQNEKETWEVHASYEGLRFLKTYKR